MYYESFIPSKYTKNADTSFTYPLYDSIEINNSTKKITRTIHSFIPCTLGRYESLFMIKDKKSRNSSNANDSAKLFSIVLDNFMFCRFLVTTSDNHLIYRNSIIGKDVVSLYRKNCIEAVSYLADDSDDEEDILNEVDNAMVLDASAIVYCCLLIDYFSENENIKFRERKDLCESFINLEAFNEPLRCGCLNSDKMIYFYTKRYLKDYVIDSYYLDFGINLLSEVKSESIINNGKLNWILEYPMKILSTDQDKLCYKRYIDYESMDNNDVAKMIQCEKHIMGKNYSQLIICKHLNGCINVYQYENTIKYRVRIHGNNDVIVSYGVLLILETLLNELASFLDIMNLSDKSITYHSSINVKFPTDAFIETLHYCDRYILAVIAFILCLLSQGFIERGLLKRLNTSVTNSTFFTGTVRLGSLWQIITDPDLLASYMLENFNFIKAIKCIHTGLIPIFKTAQLNFNCCTNRALLDAAFDESDLTYLTDTLVFLKHDWFKSIIRIRLTKANFRHDIHKILKISADSDILTFDRLTILEILNEYIYS